MSAHKKKTNRKTQLEVPFPVTIKNLDLLGAKVARAQTAADKVNGIGTVRDISSYIYRESRDIIPNYAKAYRLKLALENIKPDEKNPKEKIDALTADVNKIMESLETRALLSVEKAILEINKLPSAVNGVYQQLRMIFNEVPAKKEMQAEATKPSNGQEIPAQTTTMARTEAGIISFTSNVGREEGNLRGAQTIGGLESVLDAVHEEGKIRKKC